ncbi:MAG: hypothetical protein ABSG51_03925 [Terracidiphilus sp.]|jgi:hypothetical protein
MELLDRYLQAVKRHLPWQRQDDIVAELRANLEAQLEEKEGELGRPLTKSEAEEWLKQLGAPIHMAARYKPHQYLIGPNIFPIYVTVLKLAATWCMIIYCIVSLSLMITGGPSLSALAEALIRVPGVLMTTAAWVTLIFAVIDYVVTHHQMKISSLAAPAGGWSLADLPPLEPESMKGKKPRSFAQSVAEAAFGAFFLAWMLLIPSHPWMLWGPGVHFWKMSPYELGPVWIQFYWWSVALSALHLGWLVVQLLRRTWQKKRPLIHAVMRAVGLIPVILVLAVRDHALVLLKNPMLDHARYGLTLDVINTSIYWGFFVVLLIAGGQLAVDVGRMVRESLRQRARSMPEPSGTVKG